MILFDNNNAPKKADLRKQESFEVSGRLVLMGSIITGSGFLALSVWLMRDVLCMI